MNAWIFSTPSGSIRGAMSTSTEGGGVDVVLADGDQAGAAAHRGADQHRPPAAERGDDVLRSSTMTSWPYCPSGAQSESPWPRASKATAW